MDIYVGNHEEYIAKTLFSKINKRKVSYLDLFQSFFSFLSSLVCVVILRIFFFHFKNNYVVLFR